jgi:xanthine dehydrogenase YagR molybdenum-binding subunit
MIDPAAPAPVGNMGQPIPRYDARAKVTGKAVYAAAAALPDVAFACLLSSRIAKGRIKAFDLKAARALPGVLDILTYEMIGDGIRKVKFFAEGRPASNSVVPLGSPEIAYARQTIAMVLAETLEAAQDTAYQIGVEYEEAPSTATFDSKGAVEQELAQQNKKYDDPKVGDFAAAYDAAPVKIDASYSTPAQHHNPIELFATQCVWSGSQLTVHEPSQNVYGIKNGLAAQLGIELSQIRVISRYVGGAFGSKGALTQRTAMVAVAARGSGGRSSLSRPASKALRLRHFAPRRGSACSSPPPGTESVMPSVTKDQRSRREPILTRSPAPTHRRACTPAPMSRAT